MRARTHGDARRITWLTADFPARLEMGWPMLAYSAGGYDSVPRSGPYPVPAAAARAGEHQLGQGLEELREKRASSSSPDPRYGLTTCPY